MVRSFSILGFALAGVTGVFVGLGACTTQVIAVSGPGGAGGVGVGGAGAVTAVTFAASSVSQGGSGGCSTPAIVGLLMDCSGSAASVGTGAVACSHGVCDQGDHTWDEDCDQDGCDCRYDNAIICSCVFAPPETGCSGLHGCCPAPWDML